MYYELYSHTKNENKNNSNSLNIESKAFHLSSRNAPKKVFFPTFHPTANCSLQIYNLSTEQNGGTGMYHALCAFLQSAEISAYITHLQILYNPCCLSLSLVSISVELGDSHSRHLL